MALATRLHRKSFMDAFRIVAFGGASTTAQGEDRVPKPMGQVRGCKGGVRAILDYM